MDWKPSVSTFALIFLAEIAGKTTLATIMLAVGSYPWEVFLGAGTAFTIHVGIALALGGLASLLPAQVVQGAVGVLFLALALWLWHQADGAPRPVATGAGFARAFGIIFLAQWGDPSQLATAALAAKYGAAVVAIPATLAFWSIAGIASWIGHYSKTRMPVRRLHQVAAILFTAAGLTLLLGLISF